MPRTQRDDPGAKITFLMAAISKSIASTITYPFSLAKSRAQTSSSPPVNVDSARELKKDVYVFSNTSDTKKAGSDAEKIARSSTVFSTILKIYRTEGAAALYEGILGEILKGFFSHGITMLVKESVHKLIIQTYYMILKALNKYPSPAQIADQAGVAVSEGYGVVVQKVGNVVESGKGVAGDAVERAGVLGNNATEAAKTAGSAGKDAIANTAEKIGVVGNKASDPGMSGEELVSKDAGHLLGNAQDQLGDKLVGGGNGLKPEKE